MVDRHQESRCSTRLGDGTATDRAQPRALGDHQGMAGRVAALLLVLAGFVTMGSVGLPEPNGFDRTGVLAVGAIASAVGAVLLLLPWHRWSTKVSLVLVVPALTLIALHNWYGGQDAYRYSIFFLVVFVWAGTFHPRWTSAVLAIPTLVAYLVPLLAAHASASALASTAYAIPLFIVVGEILAWRSVRVGQLEAELREAALHDPLTGLANRRLAVDRLGQLLARTERSDAFAHVLYIDVDEFKTVNDTYGHEAGDELLVTVAHALTSVVRASDTVARLAGDEFLVEVESDHVDAGRETAERIIEALHHLTGVEGPALVPTVSIGVARARGGEIEPDALLRAADAALYAAKHSGKDRVVEQVAEPGGLVIDARAS